MLYHPGKVIAVFSAGKNVKSLDNSIQVTLEMWDENVLTFNISSKLGKIVKEDDIVIVDYSPKSDKVPIPKHEIVKVLKANEGKEMWKKYKEYLKKMRPQKTTNSDPVQVQRPNVQYIG
ncbi:MAG: hypothetical protein PHU12_01695 [Candidatus Aenigmarchaeota archaeon]|nr:hypothetical protein [Candidatus Aenigmarchaeota archaeon]